MAAVVTRYHFERHGVGKCTTYSINPIYKEETPKEETAAAAAAAAVMVHSNQEKQHLPPPAKRKRTMTVTVVNYLLRVAVGARAA